MSRVGDYVTQGPIPGTSLIQLTRGQFALVDTDDVEALVEGPKWYANLISGCLRAVRKIPVGGGKRHTQYMSIFLMTPNEGLLVDHINGDSLDNRRCNLRVVTTRQNGQNLQSHRNGRLVGASWYKGKGRWRSECEVNGNRKHLGIFDTEIEAHQAYVEYLESMGEEIL